MYFFYSGIRHILQNLESRERNTREREAVAVGENKLETRKEPKKRGIIKTLTFVFSYILPSLPPPLQIEEGRTSVGRRANRRSIHLISDFGFPSKSSGL